MNEIRKITSRDNEQLKYARRVRDGKEDGKIFLEGLRLVGEAALSQSVADTVFVSSGRLEQLNQTDLEEWLRMQRTFEVSDAILQSLADTNNAQGIVVIAERPDTGPQKIEATDAISSSVVVFLHEINNPSNLGAVIRTAEAAGVRGLIVSDGSADVFSPKALRAAMGSSLRLPIWTGVEFDEAIDWARANGLRTTAADINGKESYTEVAWQIPRMLVLGSEAHGLDQAQLERVDELVVIPMAKGVESLNIAVACAVIVFEARRQNSVR